MTSKPPPSFYAHSGVWGDWWTLLHPPYTLWHLSYVGIGAAIAPAVDGARLLATVAAFFLAVGIGAHALDELNGRPLRTRISSGTLITTAGVSLAGAVVLGLVGTRWVGLGLIPFIVVGGLLVPAYNLEWFGARLHTEFVFAASWGAFPVLVSYFTQMERLDAVAVIGAVAAFALSVAQRSLSSPARLLRRRVRRVGGEVELVDGEVIPLDATAMLRPLERALRATSWGLVALAVALVANRLT
jgi:hypothetical protein